MDKGMLSLEAKFDCDLIKTEGDSVRHLLIDVKAKKIGSTKVKRANLNIALVIDVSTSMRGSRLANAKIAASKLIESLGDDDFLSIVSFGNDVVTHISGRCMNKENKKQAIKLVFGLEHRIYTNLSGGWLAGASSVAATMEDEGETHGHVILLSDGYANVGILDPDIMLQHSEQLRLRGVCTSTVGIGDDYSSVLLRRLADYGGGRLHDAEHAEEIASVLLGELEEMRSSVIDDVNVEVAVPAGVRVRNLSCFPEIEKDGKRTFNLGSIGDGGSKRILLRVFAPKGVEGDELSFKCEATAVSSNRSVDISGEDRAYLYYASGRKYKNKVLNNQVAFPISQIWQAQVVSQAAEINRNGNFKMLAMYLEKELAHFVVYTRNLPEADYLVQELSLLLENREKQWEERLRKEMELTSYRTITTSVDYRSGKRDPWSTTMGSG